MKLQSVLFTEFSEGQDDEAIIKVKSEMSNIAKSLTPFKICPDGEIETATSYHNKFDKDQNIARANQYFIGHWLDFLHAHRAGIIPRRKAYIVGD